MKKTEIFILAFAVLIFSMAAAYNVYKNALTHLAEEATLTISEILTAQTRYRDKLGTFTDVNNPKTSEMFINLTKNRFFNDIATSYDENIFEVILTVNEGFFKGSTARAKYVWLEETFFEINPKTKIPLRHL